MRHAVIPLLFCGLIPAGCVPPSATLSTLESQQSAISAIRASYDTDLTLLAAQLDAALSMHRTLLLGRIDRQLVELGYLDADGAAQRLRDDLADASRTNFLVDDLRAGRMTLDEADRLLADYRAAESLTDPLAADIRARLLQRLHPVGEFDAAARSLRAAMDEHAADVAWLFQESDQSIQVLRAYAGQRPRLREAASANAPELWSRFVLSRITDPSQRAAAERLLAELLSLTTAAVHAN